MICAPSRAHRDFYFCQFLVYMVHRSVRLRAARTAVHTSASHISLSSDTPYYSEPRRKDFLGKLLTERAYPAAFPDTRLGMLPGWAVRTSYMWRRPNPCSRPSACLNVTPSHKWHAIAARCSVHILFTMPMKPEHTPSINRVFTKLVCSVTSCPPRFLARERKDLWHSIF